MICAGVPDRDLVLSLTPDKAEALAERFERVSEVLGTKTKKPRYSAVLSIMSDHVAEAQQLLEKVLDEKAKRWRLDEVVTHTGKPSESLLPGEAQEACDSRRSAHGDSRAGRRVHRECGSRKPRSDRPRRSRNCMSRAWRIALLTAVVATASVSSERGSEESRGGRSRRARSGSSATGRRQTRTLRGDAAVAMWIMPTELREISGLALTPQTDACSRMTMRSARSTRSILVAVTILKSFMLGNGPHADFEAIAIAGNDIYLLASKGLLFRFREGANGASVPYTVHDTHLGKECELEGAVSSLTARGSSFHARPCT